MNTQLDAVFRMSGRIGLTALTVLLCALIAGCSQSSKGSYEDCVIEGAKEAKTDLAMSYLENACREKYPDSERSSEPESKTVTNCNVTWNGTTFVKGLPESQSEFVAIRFPNTPDRLWLPAPIVVGKSFIRLHSSEITKICPSLTVPEE